MYFNDIQGDRSVTNTMLSDRNNESIEEEKEDSTKLLTVSPRFGA